MGSFTLCGKNSRAMRVASFHRLASLYALTASSGFLACEVESYRVCYKLQVTSYKLQATRLQVASSHAYTLQLQVTVTSNK